MAGRVAVAAWVVALWGASGSASEWPSFRGPGASGVADGQGLPAVWSVGTGTGVAWSTPIPGYGHSSPVVAGGRVFVTTAVGEGRAELVLGDEGGIAAATDTGPHSWRVLALDADAGGVLWESAIFEGEPRAKRHVKGSYANATPAVAGDTVVALLGSQGIVALDVATGEERWRADLGTLNPGLLGDSSSEWGHASSPIIDRGRVFVQADRHADSFLTALSLETGERLWTVPRDERPVWATPTIVEAGGQRRDLVVVGGNYVRGYDPATGAELWRFGDEAEVKTPTPFVHEGLILLAGGYRGRPMIALRTGASGDVSLPEAESRGEFVAWRTEPGGPYTSTPVAYRGLLYSVRDEGILQVHDLADGSLVHRERTEATHAASLLASDGHLFVPTEGGAVLVYRTGREPELVARNEMGEGCMATPAIADRTLFVRTTGHVYAIRGDEGATISAGSAPPAKVSPR